MTLVNREIVDEAVRILGRSDITDDQAELEISGLVGDPITVRRLIDFIREAFGLVLVSHMAKVVVPTKFHARSVAGTVKSFALTEEPILVDSLKIAQQLYHNGPRETFQNIAVCSATLQAASIGLDRHISLVGAILSGPLMLGIPAEIYPEQPVPLLRRVFLGWFRLVARFKQIFG